jgi:hypothetical protein
MEMVVEYEVVYFLVSRFGRDRLVDSLDPCRYSLKTFLVPIEILHPHESVLNDIVDYIMRDLLSTGFLKYPIVVDARTLVVLDGHHRLEVLKSLGLRYIPAFLIDYAEDYVTVYPLRKEIPVSKTLIIDTALRNSLYPPKTSKHVYIGFSIQPTYIPLEVLKALSQNSFAERSYPLPILKQH